MKLAHLSDLHICMKNKPKNLSRTRRLIEYALNQDVDHFVITGDLTNNAEAKDFIALRKLFEEFDLLDAGKLTLVIGNHDIYGGVYLAEEILTFPARCEKTDFYQKVREFKNYFLEVFENSFTPIPGNIFPFAKLIDDVVLIGLNSITPYSLLKNPAASKGKIGREQQKQLIKILSQPAYQNKIKIILVHHHFNKKSQGAFEKHLTFLHSIERYAGKLRKKKRLMNLFDRFNINLILHGHLHESTEYIRKGLRFMNAGGAIDKNKPGKLKINLITISPDWIKTEIRTIPEKIKFVPQPVPEEEFVLAEQPF